MPRCEVCFRHCSLQEGQTGFCFARSCKGGKIYARNYGKATTLALDPIEKKPLMRFYPGSRILSVGSSGCNLRCPFCQNSEISWSEAARIYAAEEPNLSPELAVDTALQMRSKGNIGIAFTYNEPLVGYEFVRDTAKLARECGLKTVLVTNGTASLSVLDEVAPFIDAMNIDLKGFTREYYRDVLGGDLDMVLDFITSAIRHCHVELTTLVVPGENDSEEEMLRLVKWIAALNPLCQANSETSVPLHLTRFFPRAKMMDRPATDVPHLRHLAEVAREHLSYVYVGNC